MTSSSGDGKTLPSGVLQLYYRSSLGIRESIPNECTLGAVGEKQTNLLHIHFVAIQSHVSSEMIWKVHCDVPENHHDQFVENVCRTR